MSSTYRVGPGGLGGLDGLGAGRPLARRLIAMALGAAASLWAMGTAQADPFMVFNDKVAFRNTLQTPYALTDTWDNGGTNTPYAYTASTPAGDFRVRVSTVGPQPNGRIIHGDTLSPNNSQHGLLLEPTPLGGNPLGFPTAFGLDVYATVPIVGPLPTDITVTATTSQGEQIAVTRSSDNPFAGFIVNKAGVYIRSVRIESDGTAFVTADNVHVGNGPRAVFSIDMPAGSLDFGDWAVGSTSVTRVLRVINYSDTDQTVQLVGGAPDNIANFSATDECTGRVIAANQGACTLRYVFHPASLGAKSSVVTLALGDGLVHTFALSGNGIAPTVPGAPVLGNPVAGPGQVQFDVSTPNDGGSPVTQYQITCEALAAASVTATGAGPTVTVTGMTPGATYACVARATNANGSGNWSDPAVRVTLSEATPVPTLGQWGLLLLAMAAAGMGLRRLRPRA